MFGLFNKEKALERKYKKLGKKLLNMYAQTAERKFVSQQLAELGTPKAVNLLLSRFEKNTKNHTIDRDEKNFIFELLVDMGKTKVAEFTIAHIKGGALNVNWPLKTLRKLLNQYEVAELIAECLEAEDTEYAVSPERKEELVLSAADFKLERLGKALVPFVEDASEGIRWQAIDSLFKGGYPFAAEPIMKRLSGEEESKRITSKILEEVVDTDWKVTGHRAAIEENLPEGYAITRPGTIRKRG